MIRYTAHRSALFKPTIAAGQHNIQLACSSQRIFKEHFIKIAQTKEQQAIAVLFLQRQILLHHGCQACRHGLFSSPRSIITQTVSANLSAHSSMHASAASAAITAACCGVFIEIRANACRNLTVDALHQVFKFMLRLEHLNEGL